MRYLVVPLLNVVGCLLPLDGVRAGSDDGVPSAVCFTIRPREPVRIDEASQLDRCSIDGKDRFTPAELVEALERLPPKTLESGVQYNCGSKRASPFRFLREVSAFCRRRNLPLTVIHRTGGGIGADIVEWQCSLAGKSWRHRPR